MRRNVKWSGVILVTMLLSQAASGEVRHLRLEVTPGISFVDTGYLRVNAAKYGLVNAVLKHESFSGDVFAGTDVIDGITIGVQVGGLSVGEFQGQVAESLFFEPFGRSVATQRVIDPIFNIAPVVLGVVRLKLLSGNHSSVNLGLGLGTAQFTLRHFSSRSFGMVPVHSYVSHDYSDVSKTAAMVSMDARYRPWSWFALLVRLAYLSIPAADFPKRRLLRLSIRDPVLNTST